MGDLPEPSVQTFNGVTQGGTLVTERPLVFLGFLVFLGQRQSKVAGCVSLVTPPLASILVTETLYPDQGKAATAWPSPGIVWSVSFAQSTLSRWPT